MTNEELLDIYDSIAEEIDDEILDEADELFNICLLYTSPSPRDRG